MLTLVRRQPQQPRARFAPRSPPRFARRAPASPAQARGSPFADALTACALCFAQVHRPLRRLPRTAGRDAPGTRAGAPAEPARTSPGTASRSLLRPAVRSIATAAPPRVPRRCRFPHRSYRRFGRLYRPGRPWVPHLTAGRQQSKIPIASREASAHDHWLKLVPALTSAPTTHRVFAPAWIREQSVPMAVVRCG